VPHLLVARNPYYRRFRRLLSGAASASQPAFNNLKGGFFMPTNPLPTVKPHPLKAILHDKEIPCWQLIKAHSQ
jgi:hypothetical protein